MNSCVFKIRHEKNIKPIKWVMEVYFYSKEHGKTDSWVVWKGSKKPTEKQIKDMKDIFIRAIHVYRIALLPWATKAMIDQATVYEADFGV